MRVIVLLLTKQNLEKPTRDTIMKIQTLAKKLETSSTNTLKFMQKAQEAKTELSREINEYKGDDWNCKSFEIIMQIQENFTAEEIAKSANVYLILKECL
jgi:DNA polymerase IIIc chi subunit